MGNGGGPSARSRRGTGETGEGIRPRTRGPIVLAVRKSSASKMARHADAAAPNPPSYRDRDGSGPGRNAGARGRRMVPDSHHGPVTDASGRDSGHCVEDSQSLEIEAEPGSSGVRLMIPSLGRTQCQSHRIRRYSLKDETPPIIHPYIP